MALLFDAVSQFCHKQGFDRTYWLAFSGGLDSTVLLHLLVNVASLYPLKWRVVHIHHGLSVNADYWSKHCEQVCKKWNVKFDLKQINAQSISGESPEEKARQTRYAVFADLLNSQDILLTAHHMDDQAETVLLQLFRGAGPKGLAAMSHFTAFKQGFLGRPLLDFPRQTLLEYAKQNQLHWIEDESNQNINFTRNFIRHEVMPLLKTRWTSITSTLARVADHCAEAQELIESEINQYYLASQGTSFNTLSVKKILKYSEMTQRQILRYWIQKNNFPIPSTKKMYHVIHDVLHAGEDKSPCVIWGNVELRRYRDDLYIMSKLLDFDTTQIYIWEQPIGSVMVRFRCVAEKVKVYGHKHHSILNKLFQEWGVPPWLRDRIPLVFFKDQLIAAGDFFSAKGIVI